MYIEGITYSVFAQLDTDKNPVFKMVCCGIFSPRYTVRMHEKDGMLVLCMHSEFGMDIEDAAHLACQNLSHIHHFKSSVVSEANISAEEAKRISVDELAIHHCGVTCPVYPTDSYRDVYRRYFDLVNSRFNSSRTTG